MPRLTVFNSISVDGYFTDANGDMSWAYAGGDDPEFAAHTAGNATGQGMLLLGRVTYEMMASWWPTPAAIQAMPLVAKGINGMGKTVFSRTMIKADWDNSRIVSSDPVAEVRRMKATGGPDMTILGSGSIAALLAEAGLVDAWTFVVCPIALGSGRTLFSAPQPMTLQGSRAFANGKVVQSYEAA